MALWDGILAADRAIDWSTVGVSGGIPTTRTKYGSTLTPLGGTSNDAPQINAALDAAPEHTYVLLGPGTFRITTRIVMQPNVTLRGFGTESTILSNRIPAGGEWVHAVWMGPASVDDGQDSPDVSLATTISSGATAGSTSIVVASATNLTVNQLAVIVQNNITGVSSVGSDGDCGGWADEWSGLAAEGTRLQGQTVQITSKSGTTIGISPPLYTAYTSTPRIVPINSSLVGAGLEDLQIYGNGINEGTDVFYMFARDCWQKNVKGNYVGMSGGTGDYAYFHWSLRCEVRNCYFSGAYSRGTGNHNISCTLSRKSSHNLIINNIFDRGQTSVTFSFGASGNVVAYNYDTGALRPGTSPFMLGGINIHAPHCSFNLLEGNCCSWTLADRVWGTGSDNTVYRNSFRGTDRWNNPVQEGRVTVLATGEWVDSSAVALKLDGGQLRYNLVGNVIGSVEQTALGGTQYATRIYNETFNEFGTIVGMVFGYEYAQSTTPYTTALIDGNYVHTASAGVSWASGAHSLPASIFLSAKPSWWFTAVPWPFAGPDVTGGDEAGGYANRNPAKYMYEVIMGGSDGGTGSPRTFDPTQYPSGGTTPPVGTPVLSVR